MTTTANAVNGIRAALAASQLAVVVGTGVTAAATDNAPTATWRGLVEDGIDLSRGPAAGAPNGHNGRGRTPAANTTST